MKPVLLAFGNCQAFAMMKIAETLPTLADRYEICYLPSHPDLGDVVGGPGLAARCEVVWEQVGVNQRLPFRDALAPGTKRVRFPELSFPLLWPMDCTDPRNQPDPPRHWGRFPYGDRLALQLIGEGLSGNAGYEAWVERGAQTLPDLQRLLDMEMARSRRRAAEIDIEPMTFILDHWRTERLFATLNHPSNTVLWPLCMQLIEASLPALPLAQAEIGLARERFLNPEAGGVDMDWFQVVIHPLVAETFGLAWCNEETLHRCEVPGVDHPLTRRAFMADYYMAAPSP